jgi:multiple sugar transport system substrate-binding protein
VVTIQKETVLARSHLVSKGAALAVGAVGLLALTACSSGSPSASGGSNDPVTLTYAMWDAGQKPAMQAIADAYTKAHPNVKIQLQLTPYKEYWTKLQTAMTGGSGPDVMWMNGPHFQLYASGGVIAPLDDAGIDTANYPKPLVDLYTYDGKLYGAPKDFDTIGLWYNKKLFDAAGVKYPDSSWTWDTLKTSAAKLTDKAKGVWGISASQYSQENFYDTIAQAGGYVISPDHKKTGYGTPEAAKGVQLWIDLIKAGSSPDAKQMSDTAPEDLFASGKVAMFYSGSWNAGIYGVDSTLKDTVNVAPLPKGPAGGQSVIHGLANVANAKSSHVAEATSFVAFASSKQAAELNNQNHGPIPAFNGMQLSWVSAFPQYDLQHAFIDAVATSVPYPISKNTSAWNTLETDAMTKIWSGQVSVEAGLQELATKMQAALDGE